MTYFEEINIHPSWREPLREIAPLINAMGEFLQREEEAGIPIAPPAHLRWRALQTPLASTNVLIIGQDPYPTPGHAQGLAFSIAPGIWPPARSLSNIFRELSDDLSIPQPTTGDLSAWQQQGVMLLNTVLTVRAEANGAGSHRNKGWEHITAHIVDTLINRQQPLVAILWGREAQKLSPHFAGHPDSMVISSPHPSPLSARRGFFGSRPFSRANEYLRDHKLPSVEWQL
ncbi:uracil-DNA glycosylase [Corynebacterium sp. ES2794-CONJ1]|uniref:uracil-DNA glycosylase n=1 Tax=Corynebacterium sp. ES2794-CONJ1 TaxID=2980553 RepID=UPI0021DA2646|nr:uracil-DNA glycosylase [Corynebacterium sp. ES2794-CONJ1]MCU9520023.1 uracil-DNA glycosylase [Corynebacterium sp. ES2794-CONJ1]